MKRFNFVISTVGIVGLILLFESINVAARTIKEQKRKNLIQCNNNPKIGIYRKGAVATHSKECSEIGRDILRKNGSAVDAAIAALLCQGVASPNSMGIGGGFGMTIYDAASGKAEFLDARESAPAKAFRDMFQNSTMSSTVGGLAIAVPGELAGYWEAHQRYGKLPWKDLFLPAIELCKKGTEVNSYLYKILKKRVNAIRSDASLAEDFINSETNLTWAVGDKMKRHKLGKTLQKIADKGIDILYRGEMGEKIVKEIQDLGGIIDMDDLRNYKPKWKKVITSTIANNLTMYTSNLPSSGVLLTFIMNILENYISNAHKGKYFQYLIESFKWAYGRRTELGDNSSLQLDKLMAQLASKKYAAHIRQLIHDDWTSPSPEYYGAVGEGSRDSGTAHISVLAPDGSAISVTSTINQALGSMVRSPSTGIIFNDQMDDFSLPNTTNSFNLPPSPANYIAPGKRPLSSMTPTIIVDGKGKVQLVMGAAGGSKIITAVALTTILNIWGGYDIKQAIEFPRIHHQLFPMRIEAQSTFSQKILKYLTNIGHDMIYYSGVGSSVNAISNFNTRNITAFSDYRRFGIAAGF